MQGPVAVQSRARLCIHPETEGLIMRRILPVLLDSLWFALPLVAVSILLTIACRSSRAGDSRRLPRSSPEQQGVSSAGLLEFIEAADRQIDQMHSFMLARHGRVVAEG